jgi:tetratricopeptide (TPR) repeat protein
MAMTSTQRTAIVLCCLLFSGSFSTGSSAQTGLDSEIQILQRLAEERYAEGDLERAAETYQEIAGKQTEPREQAKTLFLAAWLMQLSGQEDAALTSMTRSLRMAPEQSFEASLYNRDFELLYRQALDIALQQRRRESAEKTQAAVAHMGSGRDSQARVLLESATELDPGNPSALYNLALLDLQAGAGSEALADFERVISLTYQETGPGMVELRAKSLTSLGVIYQQLGNSDDAEQSYLEATRADPREATAWTHLGLLQFHLGRFDVASTTLERAHELLPGNREVTWSLARSLLESGRAGQASTTLRTALEKHPDDAEMWQQLGQLERSRNQTTAAIQALERSVEADGENLTGIAAGSAVLLSILHLEQEDAEAALAAANRAVGWNRNDPEAWSALGQAQQAADQLAAATASFGRAAELDPGSLDRQLTLGNTLLANNQLPQAEAAYLRALTLDPNSSEASANLEAVRARIANERAIVAGKVRPRKPIAPKKIGLEFAGIDYKDLQLRGALVKQVNKKSPAARAGLRKGDLILWIGDYSVLSGKDFFQYLKRSPPGDRLDLEYLRDGRIYDVELQLR